MIQHFNIFKKKKRKKRKSKLNITKKGLALKKGINLTNQ